MDPEISRCLKEADPYHLVMDGVSSSELREESLALPDVDIVTTHLYPGNPKTFPALIHASAEKAGGRKVYVVGEFGFAGTAEMVAAMDALISSGTSGGLLWSLRFRNRDGGFYWHSEPFGGDLFKAFHWPPSRLGDPYDESRLMTTVRERAFAIRGLPVPPVPVPAPPRLLRVMNAAAIAWQGSVGAADYQVERAGNPSGPWQIIAANVDEAFTQYRPQFADENVPAGTWYYRVRARNASGFSEPSNVSGPVRVKSATLVDELADFSQVQTPFRRLATGHSQLPRRQGRRPSRRRRFRQHAGLSSCPRPSKVSAFPPFSPKIESPVKFSISDDGEHFREVPAPGGQLF